MNEQSGVTEGVSRVGQKHWQMYVAMGCVILGVLLVAQFRAQEYIGRNMIPSRRLEDLADMLRRAERDKTSLEEEVLVLRQRLSKVTTSEDVVQAVRDELYRAKVAAGLVPLVGPGITITLDDSRRQAQPGENPEIFLVHDEDILKTVNELLSAGAEAISLNGQRLVARSEIRCAGPTISVNNTRIGPPYQIMAIGDPVVLDNSLRMRDGIVDTLRAWGIEVKIAESQEVKVPAYRGSIYYQYAKPYRGAESQ